MQIFPLLLLKMMMINDTDDDDDDNDDNNHNNNNNNSGRARTIFLLQILHVLRATDCLLFNVYLGSCPEANRLEHGS